MTKSSTKLAKYLLQIEAVKLQPTNPFTWASGWKSPIYCDNRKTLSYPEVRDYIKEQFISLLNEKYSDFDYIAGVATGAIAIGALVADAINKPFVYVRSSAKDHGTKNLIEGYIEKGKKVVVIEDLISTGSSSLKAVNALREKGCEVLGMLSIFSYGFPVATENFNKENVVNTSICDYNTMIQQALDDNYVSANDIETLKQWRTNPSEWGK